MNDLITIKEMPLNERPYEKMELLGPNALSDAELLAIIIKSGTVKVRSTDLAMKILSKSNQGLLGLHQLSIDELMEIKGIGRVKAIQLKALAELSNRIAKTKKATKINVNSPSSLAELYMEDMRHLDREHMIMVMLDTKNNIIGDQIVSIGTVNASLVHPREVYIYALKKGAVNIIMIHNHPSGDSRPSKEDIFVTQRICEAGKILGIQLIDHIVIGDHDYRSMRQLGYIKEN